MARRRQSTTATNNSRNTAFGAASAAAASTGGGSAKSVSSLVRLALASNFPQGLLNAAQSYPSLSRQSSSSSSTGHHHHSHQAAAAAAAAAAAMVGSESEQVSLEEFLESCRATSLLAELEDDEELPDADDDDDNDDDNDDDYDDDENYDEEGFEPVSSRNLSLGTSRRKTWDDDHVLKRKFSALIPAFDPRPGRTNVNQTSDLDIQLQQSQSQSPTPNENLIRQKSPEQVANNNRLHFGTMMGEKVMTT